MHVVDEVLRYAWGGYRVWAATSRKLKKQVARWGFFVLLLTLAGTALGTIVPHLGLQPPLSATLPWLAAAALGTATYFASQLLNESAREAWVKTRALAEALKSESYKYVTRTAPYNVDGAPLVLAQRVDELQRIASGIIAESISEDERAKDAPSGPWAIDDYIKGRVRDQIDNFYQPAIVHHRRAVQTARVAALGLGALAVVLSASGGASGGGSGTWIAALLGTVTTAAAAIGAWFQSGHHQQNALNYQAAAAKLELLLAQRHVSGREAHLVMDAEAIFQAEHSAWLTEWQASSPPLLPSAPASGRSDSQGMSAEPLSKRVEKP